jgi:hypothetical protein
MDEQTIQFDTLKFEQEFTPPIYSLHVVFRYASTQTIADAQNYAAKKAG